MFFEDYSYKIKTINELVKIRKKINKKFVLCHGVFDIVHPGHLHHLAYAKSKADYLITSVTADKFINKGIYRPHVPEKLRALNLAMLEMIDFVVINNEKESLNILSKLKPDFYAKGFEYSRNNRPIETEKEKKIINSYGGKFLFTPGDIVYSSSKFLNLHLPNISKQKLKNLISEENIHLKNIIKDFEKFKDIKVHVVGDIIIDTLLKTELIGGQTKTPTLSVLKKEEIDFVGGAGVVAKHLASAGAKVTISSIVGDDQLGNFALKDLKKNKIKCNLIVDKNRPTTNKKSIICENHRMLKIDNLDNSPIDENKIMKLVNLIKKEKSDCVIFSDFRHGIFHKDSILKLSNSIKKGTFKVADSQVASRWGNIGEFKNFDLLTPNEKEARFALGDQDSTVNALTQFLSDISNYKYIILKLGKKGIFSVDRANKKNPNQNKAYSIDSFVSKLIDPVGSGDALLAYATLSIIVSKKLSVASILGSIAAACECEKNGNIPITKKEVLRKLEEEIMKISE